MALGGPPRSYKKELPPRLFSHQCLEGGFSEVGLSLLLLRACRLFFLHYLQALDHLECKAHYAALLALVLEVDGLVIIVDEDLLHKSAAVVQSLRPIWDGLVLHPAGLLAHPRLLLSSR